jgi:hypothetical protein
MQQKITKFVRVGFWAEEADLESDDGDSAY